MTILDFKFLADENVHLEVVRFLRDQGCDVFAVRESRLAGSSDEQLLRHAITEDRVVLTHDSDFGALALLADQPPVGIVYLRPGHIDPVFTIETLRVILRQDLTLTRPFILVARRTKDRVVLRLRTW